MTQKRQFVKPIFVCGRLDTLVEVSYIVCKNLSVFTAKTLEDNAFFMQVCWKFLEENAGSRKICYDYLPVLF